MDTSQKLPSLTLETLKHLNQGAFGPTVDMALERVARDMDARPNLKKARTVTITITLEPLGDGPMNGLSAVKVEAQVGIKVPAHKTRGEFLDVRQADEHGVYAPQMVFTQLMEPLFNDDKGKN